MRLWFYKSSKGQAEFRPFIKCHTFLTASVSQSVTTYIFSSENLGLIELKFYMEYSLDKLYRYDICLVTWPKWPPRPYMVKQNPDVCQ